MRRLLAASVNSPLLFGHRLWQETRVPLFEQSVELGGYQGLAEPSIRRVTFGRGYVSDSLLELFQENLEHYPVLLPVRLEDDRLSAFHICVCTTAPSGAGCGR